MTRYTSVMPKNKRPQSPKPAGRSLATRDMMLYAAQRGQAPTDKAANAYSRKVKHSNNGYIED